MAIIYIYIFIYIIILICILRVVRRPSSSVVVRRRPPSSYYEIVYSFVCWYCLLFHLFETIHESVFDWLHEWDGLIAEEGVAFHAAY